MKAFGLAQRRGSSAKQAWLALVLAATASLEALPPQVRAQARGGGSAASTPAPAADGLQLRVRRLPDAVELVLVDAGLGASLTQQPLGNQWLGELQTDRARSLKVGPQSLALAADGMERISFEGSGTSFRLTVTAAAGRNLPQPVVSSDGRDLVVRFPAAPNVLAQTATPNLRKPSPVPMPANVPPLRPRAVAPPVGDMAIGTMTLRNRGLIKLSGPPVTLTTRGANARDVLLVLAQMGGYGFAFSEPIAIQQKETREGSSANNRTETKEVEKKPGFIPPVTVSFKNEVYERAFNFVLLSAGLQARREGNTIIVGENILSKTIGSQVSKVYRLNQVSSSSAADYLANLGASVTKTNTTLTSITTGGDLNQPTGAPNAATTVTGSETKIEAYSAGTGPLVGLLATTDSRLSTITLVGESDVVAVAEQYLKQLDLRQRQVALSLKILDVNLDNASEIDNSFAFRFGNNFIINESGQLLAQFGRSEGTDPIGFTTTTTETVTQSGNASDSASDSATSSASDSTSGSTNSTASGATSGTTSLNSISFTSDEFATVSDERLQETASKLDFAIEGSVNYNPVDRTFIFVPDASTGTGSDAQTTDLARSISSLISSSTGISIKDISTATNTTSSSTNSGTNSGTTSSTSSSSNSTSSSSGFGGTATKTTTRSEQKTPIGGSSADKFYDFLRAQIISTSTKVLASPTLILQDNPGFLREEGSGSSSSSGGGQTQQGIRPIGIDSPIGRRRANEGVITVGTNVVTSYNISSTQGALQCIPELSPAGLVLGARVEKIDDNGFVSFSLSPSISAITATENPPIGCGSRLNILSVRSLDTGALRVRDGQTLVLTGVISDFDRAEVSKWPILGDIPLIGQFFRASGRRREKRELVILATPRIIDDEQGGAYGYGYRPSTNDARQLFYGSGQR